MTNSRADRYESSGFRVQGSGKKATPDVNQTMKGRGICLDAIRQTFTLIEVVVAIGILGLGLVAAMSFSIQSNTRVERAFNKWREQHILAQAAEFYLLQGPNVQPADDVFPYSSEGYSVSCAVDEPSGLPASVEAHARNWRLALYKISLSTPEGRTRSLHIEKIIKEETP